MLRGSFYNLTGSKRAEDGQWTFDIRLDATHRVYEGHFPGRPVVPGACMLTVIRECLTDAAGPGGFTEINQCKFLAPIVPAKDEKLRIRLTRSGEGAVCATVETAAGVALKLKGKYVVQGG